MKNLLLFLLLLTSSVLAETRTEIEARIRRDNPTSDGVTTGHPHYEALITQWVNAEVQRQAEAEVVTVPMVNLRLVLIEQDLQPAILAAMAAIPDAKERAKAEAWWQTATVVRRDHPLVLQLATALGKTAAEVDAIFNAAQQLDTVP